jgi:hypothetical protein
MLIETVNHGLRVELVAAVALDFADISRQLGHSRLCARRLIAWTHSTFNPWLGCLRVSPA